MSTINKMNLIFLYITFNTTLLAQLLNRRFELSLVRLVKHYSIYYIALKHLHPIANIICVMRPFI